VKNKLIVIGIIVLFIGITISAGATTTTNPPSKQQGVTNTFPYARIEMENGLADCFNEACWHHFPLLNKLIRINRSFTNGLFLNTWGLIILEGELKVKPLVRKEIILYPGDTIHMKMSSGYQGGFWKQPYPPYEHIYFTNLSLIALGITIEKNC
jgi:hypothetical protein